MPSKFYITTPIYYPNARAAPRARLHDARRRHVARYHRLSGDDTFFLTGTDEHGIKMVKTAAEQKIEPRCWPIASSRSSSRLWKELDITHDDFIRTTADRHKAAVQEIVQQLLANGDIYLGSYEGWYDEGQEEFVTETEAKDQRIQVGHQRQAAVRYTEPSYFFRLSKYVAAGAGSTSKSIRSSSSRSRAATK